MMFTPFKWNFVARTFLKLFLSYDFKNRNIIAFCCCFLYFSFVGYLFFGHQCERFYNAGNLTIDSILSRVKKQYSRVIKFFKTSYQLHFLFSWNVFWTLIKETKNLLKIHSFIPVPSNTAGPIWNIWSSHAKEKKSHLYINHVKRPQFRTIFNRCNMQWHLTSDDVEISCTGIVLWQQLLYCSVIYERIIQVQVRSIGVYLHQ